MPDDKFFMRLAIGLAKRGLGKASPNPMVGAVLVRNGKIIGKGYHAKAGSAHAEIAAFKNAKKNVAGATLYINLEPCNHFGKTPPCTDEIIKNRIKRVVASIKDPNPLNNGRGFRRLKRAGIEVKTGILSGEASQLNRAFIKYITEKKPFVITKVAQSVDGKIATRTGDSKWISCEESRRYVHRLRSQVDAVMVGAGTIVRDDPLLTARVKGVGCRVKGVGCRVKDIQPIKVIVDSRLETPLKARIFSKESPARVIMAITKKAPKDKIKKIQETGAEILFLEGIDNRVNLKQLMKELGKREIASVLVEGGGELIAGLIGAKLVDKLLFFISPKIVGGRDAKTSVEGKGIESIAGARRLKDLKYRRVGEDLLIESTLVRCK